LGDKSAAVRPFPDLIAKPKDSTMPTSHFAGLPVPLRLAGAFAALFLLICVPTVQAQTPDPVVARVNGVEIRQSDLVIAEQEAGQTPQMSADAKRDYLVAFMTDMILVSKAAEDKKIADSDDFKKRLAFARNKLLMSILLESTGKAALTDGAMRKVYDDAIKQMPEEQEVRARHILIRAAASDEKAGKAAEEKIKAILVRLNKGEDFAKLATELTEDPSGKANGGDLGFFGKEQMVPEFSVAAFALEPGKFSEPVKTQFGWHVLKVEEKRKKPVPGFDDVKSQIEAFVVRKAQAELVTKLREGAKVERLDKPAAADKPEAKPADKPAEPAKK
jgi:peptidyl-prolyl cis-trans isomerase C